MELSNAVGRYLSSAARQRELLGGHTYLMQVQSWKESEGVLQIVFYLVGKWCRGLYSSRVIWERAGNSELVGLMTGGGNSHHCSTMLIPKRQPDNAAT